MNNKLYSQLLYITSAAVRGWTIFKCPAERKAVAVVRQHFRLSSTTSTDENRTPFQCLKENTCFPIGKFVSLTKIANEVKL
jgi:hypothetical protein